MQTAQMALMAEGELYRFRTCCRRRGAVVKSGCGGSFTMNTTFTAIYEQGVLRPLTPLSLPEHTRVEVRIVPRPARAERAHPDRQRVYEALMDAGLVKLQPASEFMPYVSEAELARAAAELTLAAAESALAGPISDLIIAERAESGY
jgi:predicted DNA-binding antitoxin AbrB/MazE fold protein